MFVVPPPPSPLASLASQPPIDCTPLEQAINAELAYYRQFDLLAVTDTDEVAWQQSQAVYNLLRPLASEWPYPSFTRFVLERHGYSLHRYMAHHLSPQAWTCWFGQRGLLAPF